MASLPPDKHQDQSEDGRGDPSASGFREQRGHQAQAQGNGGDGFFFVRFLKENQAKRLLGLFFLLLNDLFAGSPG